MFGLIEVSAA